MMNEIITVLLTISGVCGALITISGFVALIAKKPKNWIKNLIKEAQAEYTKEIKKLLEEINEKVAINKNGELASLRHSITDIYETYKDDETLPVHIKKDLCSLYENYMKLGGNSYVVELFEVMHSWKIK